jgi:hypothetical protein
MISFATRREKVLMKMKKKLSTVQDTIMCKKVHVKRVLTMAEYLSVQETLKELNLKVQRFKPLI